MMNVTKEMTKVEKFNVLLTIEEIANNEILSEFVKHEIELVQKKNGRTKPSKDQEANIALKKIIVDTIRGLGAPARAEEIRRANSELLTYSGQKITALLTQLSNDGIVNRVTDKKKTYFSISE